MESLLDKIALLAVCSIAFIVVPVDATGIALLLGCFTISVAAALLPERPGLGLLSLALIAACAYAPATIFVAPIVYSLMSARNPWFRALPIVAIFAALWRLPFELWVLGVMFDLVACMLAYRTSVLLNERRQYRVLRDRLREQSISLEERNRRLCEEMDALGQQDDAEPRFQAHDLRPTLSLASLTERELEVVAYVAQGLDNREIAAEVYASEGTVRNHISAILQKTGLRNRTQLAVAYLTAHKR